MPDEDFAAAGQVAQAEDRGTRLRSLAAPKSAVSNVLTLLLVLAIQSCVTGSVVVRSCGGQVPTEVSRYRARPRKEHDMRYVLSVILLLALLPVALAQDNEAEKLFRDLEKKIKAADAVHVTVAIEIKAIPGREEETTFKGKIRKARSSFLFTKDNKARLMISGFSVGLEMVSNGKQLKLATEEGEARSIDQAEPAPTPKKFHGMLSTLVSRTGVAATAVAMPFLLKFGLGENDIEAGDRNRAEAWDFNLGAAQKVGGRDAKVVSYIFGPKDEKDAERFTLWMDAKTLLPMKRVVVLKSQYLHITEIYTEFKFDPKIDAKAFEMVPVPAPPNEAEKLFRAMEAKISAAKAVQVTFDIEMKGKGEEGKLKGSLLFMKDNKARLKMSGNETGKEVTNEMISDGKRIKLAVLPETIGKAKEERTPKILHSLLSTMVSGPGLSLTYDLLNFPAWLTHDLLTPGTNIPAGLPFRVVYFEASAAEKVGGRDAMVVTYSVLLRGDHCEVTLWIDVETMLPVKRLIVAEGKGEAIRITEICNFNLNPKVEAGAFALTSTQQKAEVSPSEVVKQWIDAAAKRDMKTVAKLASKTTRKQFLKLLEDQLFLDYRGETKIIHEEILADK
jgi:outer membrane lipoprotein-sorting protein